VQFSFDKIELDVWINNEIHPAQYCCNSQLLNNKRSAESDSLWNNYYNKIPGPDEPGKSVKLF
jgi:hypothetical protein